MLWENLRERSYDGSFVELVEGLARVRAVVFDEIPAASMPAFQAVKIMPPRWVERLV